MKSPQLSTAIIALVFAVVAFFLFNFNLFSASPISIAIVVFVTTFISPLLFDSGIAKDSKAEESTDEIKTLYVGNLPYRANEVTVRELFAEHGQVHSVRLMKDKHTGKRRGFGFVEMSANDSDRAVTALNDTEFQQRTLKVREAKERPEQGDEVE